MVNKLPRQRPAERWKSKITHNSLILLLYLHAYFVGIPVKNIAITALVSPANSFINMLVNNIVDFHTCPP